MQFSEVIYTDHVYNFDTSTLFTNGADYTGFTGDEPAGCTLNAVGAVTCTDTVSAPGVYSPTVTCDNAGAGAVSKLVHF